jgi:2'-5' RNA ligase
VTITEQATPGPPPLTDAVSSEEVPPTSGNTISGLVLSSPLSGGLSTISGQLDLAATVTVAPEAMKPPGLPVPDDPAAISIFTAHRVNSILHQVAHATERMQAAQAATGDLREYHVTHIVKHLERALNSAHEMTENLREHYGPEADELQQVKETVGLARGYELNARSGMISLDLPAGTIAPAPDGVSDHHITVVYLGADVDDEAFARACDRAKDAAAAMPGPLSGTVGGIGTFPPSDGSDGKVPAWAGVVLPGAERLRSALEDLSASEHKDWHPHVTVAYTEPGEALPPPVPATAVMFTSLSVHRGDDEVVRFPLGGSAAGLATGTISGQALGLAKAVSETTKAATTAHLTETTLHELTHASLHAQAMGKDDPDGDEWAFDGDHCRSHLAGAVEHAGKLWEHFVDNYPAEGKWLVGIARITHPLEAQQHAGDDETISGQLDLTRP